MTHPLSHTNKQTEGSVNVTRGSNYWLPIYKDRYINKYV